MAARKNAEKIDFLPGSIHKVTEGGGNGEIWETFFTCLRAQRGAATLRSCPSRNNLRSPPLPTRSWPRSHSSNAAGFHCTADCVIRTVFKIREQLYWNSRITGIVLARARRPGVTLARVGGRPRPIAHKNPLTVCMRHDYRSDLYTLLKPRVERTRNGMRAPMKSSQARNVKQRSKNHIFRLNVCDLNFFFNIEHGLFYL